MQLHQRACRQDRAINNAPEVSLTVLVETFVFGVIYNLLRYPMVELLHDRGQDAPEGADGRPHRAVRAHWLLRVFRLRPRRAVHGEGLCRRRAGLLIRVGILKMLVTFAFYLFLAPVNAATIFVYPIILVVKEFVALAFAVLELLGVVASDEQLSENTRFEILRGQTKGDNARRVPEVAEKVVAYACVWLLFSLLLQRNMPRDMFLPFVLAICSTCVVVPVGFFYRHRMQEEVTDLNGSNQSLLTQVSWVNHMGKNIRNLSLSNAQLPSDMNCVEVSAECPWLEKFRADQLRMAANFLPVMGPRRASWATTSGSASRAASPGPPAWRATSRSSCSAPLPWRSLSS